jgi:hypothetical protein
MTAELPGRIINPDTHLAMRLFRNFMKLFFVSRARQERTESDPFNELDDQYFTCTSTPAIQM